MDAQVTSALIGGGCTLFGVAFGVVGTLVAARAQITGAKAQADAMLEQAKATYRAALDQAHAAQRAAHEQWRRGVQRDAYAAFIAALAEVERQVTQPDLLTSEDSDSTGPLGTALRTLRATRAALELEGPAPLAMRAAEACIRTDAVVRYAIQLAPRANALRILSHAITNATTAERENPRSPVGLSLTAHQDLTRFREASFQYEAGRIDHDAYDTARQRAASSLDACGLLTAQQIRALLSDPSWDGALQTGREHADATQRLAEARTAFVEAAREHLDPLR
ncbi:hypothetical protein ACF08N_00200 [Streptomyces sp. NPDC015127]|uniref:hypothetical protein n=1 Tax=Streptomyces sp. NPDC015127 TaxID=3364939 RepID=UPI0036FE39C6